MASKLTDQPAQTQGIAASRRVTSGGDAEKLAALLQFEGDIRRQQTVNELQYLVTNDTRRVLAYGQMFVLRRASMGDGYQVKCASSLATVDRNAPLLQGIESLLKRLADEFGLGKPQDFTATAFSDDAAIAEYPFPQMRWQPLADADGTVFGGLLVAGEEPLRKGETVRLERIAETTAHGWRALSGNRPVRRLPSIDRKKKLWIAAGLAVFLLFPVRLTALAPAEIVAQRPFVVSAPFSGVVASIEIAPNAPVTAGQTLLRFDDVRLANELKLAEEKLAVAKSRVERSTSSAFSSNDETPDIAIMRAEFDLAQAEYEYAQEVMGRSEIKAPRAGMALYSDRRDWEGRAVNVGDPIMQVVDPGKVMMRIDLPAAEQMTLEKGAKVKMWLDAQPLWAIDGTLETASYQARQTPDGTLAFAITAMPDSSTPRIGSRGTAKVYGRWVPFAYSLFKRPISSLRQFIGL